MCGLLDINDSLNLVYTMLVNSQPINNYNSNLNLNKSKF